MIDEAIGKILGMAMAYVASAAGMFVEYVNYRKRIVNRGASVMNWGVNYDNAAIRASRNMKGKASDDG